MVGGAMSRERDEGAEYGLGHTGAADDDTHAVEWLRCALGLDQDQTPFPWQTDLLRRFRRGERVSALDIPTGLGKTATMAAWLVARALGAPLPRRLVYVVDRRAVVDQATEVAESLRAWVATDRAVADALGLGDRPLPISTLRGRHVDNREWLEDPSSPAIVVGTVDMVGSRLLFSGYGVSSKMRPYHAGLLGIDTLVVLDEAHLVPAFEDLLRQIERGTNTFGSSDQALRALLPSFALLSLSATGRQKGSTALSITDADRNNPIVRERLTAKKALTTVKLVAASDAADRDDRGSSAGAEGPDGRKKEDPPKLARELAEQAWQLTNRGSAPVRCLVFCDARQDATAVAGELRTMAKSAGAPDPAVELFVGARRVRERVQARDVLERLGFLARKSVSRDRPTFLIATSAGEVGVDLDADHMVCDLVPWERMVQRLGRVNRRGGGDARVVVVVEPEPTPSDATKKAIEKRDASRSARRGLEELTAKLSALGAEKKPVPKGQRKTAEEKADDQRQKEAEQELRASIRKCQNRIKAFKDADAKTAMRHEVEVGRHRALRKLLAEVGEGGSLSPEALLQLRQRQDLAETLGEATTREPLRPELTRALVDAWSLTSLDEHPGRPDIDPWLRGFRPNDPPQTAVVWRRHLPVRDDGRFEPEAAHRFFVAAPPHTSERLETETHHVLDWLVKRAVAIGKAKAEETTLTSSTVVAVIFTARGELKGWRTLGELGDGKGKEGKKARDDLEQLLCGATLIVDARVGGLTDGLLDEKAKTIAEAADDGRTTWLVRPGTADVPVTGFRVRTLRADGEESSATVWRQPADQGWVRRYLFVTAEADDEPSEALEIDGWVGDAATEEERAEANRPQLLEEHQSWAEGCARDIGKRLGLSKEYDDLLALAARLHDEGKRAETWQRAFKAPRDGVYAKTTGPIDFALLDGYRHELGSLPYAEQDARVKTLADDDRDLVLHLIAAHHGYARPVIGTTGCDDAPPSVVDERAREVALRFARLSRRWGPWGLAWWESLLRAADQTASRRNQRVDSPESDEEQR